MKWLIVILSIFSVLTACEDKIELDVPEGSKKLVVDGILNNGDSLQRITLSNTSPYFSSTITPRVSNAIVFVTSNAGDTINFTENSLSPGDYETVYKLVDSTLNFNLNVILPDGNVYRSYEEKMHRVPKIDSLHQSDEKSPQQGDFREEGYIGYLNTKEPAGRGDYYRWVLFVNGQMLNDPFNLIVTDDRLVDGNVIRNWDLAYELQVGDYLEIHQMSISERAYNYWTLIFDQITNFGGPFSTPPAPVEGNIYNVNDKNETVLGFFGVSKVEKAGLLIVQK